MMKRYIKKDYNIIFKALSPSTEINNFNYELSSNTFILTKLEPFEDDEDTYEIIYLRIPNMNKIELSQDALDVIHIQMEDICIASNKFNQQNEIFDILKSDYKKLSEQYIKLAEEKERLDKEVIHKCLELINEKKRYINQELKNACKNPNDSSFDMREFIINDGLKDDSTSAVPSESENEKSTTKMTSPQPSTSKVVTKTTPKSSKKISPLKVKRTPSKKLFAQTQEEDSDDFDILPLNDEKTTPTRKRKSTGSNLPIKITPKKQRREEKESSVELKTEKIENHYHTYESPPSNNTENFLEHSQRIENASSQSSKDKYKTALNSDFDQCSQVFDTDLSPILKDKPTKSLIGTRKSQRKKNTNPYSVDTVNVLDNE